MFLNEDQYIMLPKQRNLEFGSQVLTSPSGTAISQRVFANKAKQRSKAANYGSGLKMSF